MQQKARRNAALRSTLFESYCDHTLTEEEYLSMKAGYDREAKELSKELNQFEKEYKRYTYDLSPQNEWIVSLKKYQKEKVLTRNILKELVKSISIFKHHEIGITWNFQDEFARLAAEAEREGL